MDIKTFLIIFSGVAWSLAYLDAIRLGLRQHTYAMPLWALALNITWELLHGLYGYAAYGMVIQVTINAVWFPLDCVILYTYFRFGRQYFPQQLDQRLFYLWSGTALAIALVLQYMFIQQFPLLVAATYSAFLQNLLMSVLFIVMLVQRGSSAGQSKLIAYSKFLGTLATSVLLGIIGYDFLGGPSLFILTIGGMIALVDLAYIILLSGVQARERHRMA